MKKIKLSKYEKDIEKNFEKSKNSKGQIKLRESLVAAAKDYIGNKKPITIRIARSDLEIMKNKASKIGIPYQTYINILIHQDAVL